MDKDSLIEVELMRIIIDETRLEQVVVLKEREGKRTLPIVIGTAEAAAIKMEISGVQPTRPLTHDLLRDAVNSLGAKLERIVVDSLKDNTFYAKLHFVNSDSKPIVVDARPSDSIALALRTKSPIFVARDVMDSVGKEEE